MWVRASAMGAVAFACVALTGCADETGQIDAQGHNGYDRMTCIYAKALALDIQYGTVLQDQRQDRIKKVTGEAKKASDQAVQQATTALISNYMAGNKKGVGTATASLVKACQL